MRLITELLEEAEAANRKDPDSFMRDSDKQELREQWILGRFADNYNKNPQRKMIYGRHLQPPEPDFEILDDVGNWLFGCRIPHECALSQIWLLESDCSKILQLA